MALFCVLCKDVGEKLVDVKDKGLKPINTAAIARGVEDHFPVGSMVHEDCRRNYVSQRNIQQWKKSQEKSNNRCSRSVNVKRTRSLSPSYKKACFLCGIKLDDEVGGKEKVHLVSDPCFEKTVYNICKQGKDEWGNEVFARQDAIGHCVAAKARYHSSCSVNSN